MITVDLATRSCLQLLPYEGRIIALQSLRCNSGSWSRQLSGFGLFCLLTLSGCSTQPQARSSHLPNIIILCADTLRADHLGAYGYSKATSPWLDELAAGAVFFEDTHSQANNTNPSHASIFTSLYMSTHGILGNKGYRLSPQAVTLAEVLEQAGYQTAGFTSIRHLSFELNGLDQGFEFHSGPPTKADQPRGILKRFSRLLERDPPRYNGRSRATKTNERVFNWLDSQNDSRPLFLFVHYFDTHTPYQPPQSYVDHFYQGNPNDPDNRSMLQLYLNHLTPKRVAVLVKWLKNTTDIDYVRALYDGAIRYLDDQLKVLAQGLQERGLWQDSIVVFTADHGESLVEHGIYFSHVGLYEPSTRIPLIIRAPDWPPGTVTLRVQSIDIFPTVLALAGIEAPGRLEGLNLVPWMTGKEGISLDDFSRPIYSEHANAQVLSITEGPWKFIHPINPLEEMSKVEELFNLEWDPLEEENLAEQHRQLASAMLQRLVQWQAQRRSSALTPLAQETSQELLEKLRSLGYLH